MSTQLWKRPPMQRTRRPAGIVWPQVPRKRIGGFLVVSEAGLLVIVAVTIKGRFLLT